MDHFARTTYFFYSMPVCLSVIQLDQETGKRNDHKHFITSYSREKVIELACFHFITLNTT